MQEPFESAEVMEIVGIKPNYLNKFVERRLYGIVPSDRMGTGRGSRRRFTTEDVFGIALVWCLFEAGLRAEVIKRVLRDVGHTKKAGANLAARKMREQGADFLLVERQTRSNEHTHKWPVQTISVLDHEQILKRLADTGTNSSLVIPVGRLFRDVTKRIATANRSSQTHPQ